MTNVLSCQTRFQDEVVKAKGCTENGEEYKGEENHKG
jgi:hypothetical protein